MPTVQRQTPYFPENWGLKRRHKGRLSDRIVLSQVEYPPIQDIYYGNKPDLLEITKLASQIVSRDIQKLLSTVDTSVFKYAVMTGIQIHGPMDTNWIYPQDFYVVGSDIRGNKQHLTLFKDLQKEQYLMMQPSLVG